MANAYLSEFLDMQCSGDVLNVVKPVQNLSKEITESMAIIKRLRRTLLSHPREYCLIDMAAGNALTSVLAAHLFRCRHVIAYDKKKRERWWEAVMGFTYVDSIDLFDFDRPFAKKSIIISVHPCQKLAEKIIDIYNTNEEVEQLILMPCCVSETKVKIPPVLQKQISGYIGSKYFLWAMHLANRCVGNVQLLRDTKVLSPKNCIIHAKRKVK